MLKRVSFSNKSFFNQSDFFLYTQLTQFLLVSVQKESCFFVGRVGANRLK